MDSLSAEDVACSVAKIGDEFAAFKDVISNCGLTGEALLKIDTEDDLNNLFRSLEICNETHRKVLREQHAALKLPPIRLIEFAKFKNHGGFPRFPDNKDLVTSLDKINRDENIIIFLSHCWLRGKANFSTNLFVTGIIFFSFSRSSRSRRLGW